MEDPSYIAQLVLRRRYHTASRAERKILKTWQTLSKANEQLLEQLSDETYLIREGLRYGKPDWAAHWGQLVTTIPALGAVDVENLPIIEEGESPWEAMNRRTKRMRRNVVIAAAVLVVLIVGIAWLVTKMYPPKLPVDPRIGSNQADQADQGLVIAKGVKGDVNFKGGVKGDVRGDIKGALQMIDGDYRATTPKGGRYKVTLPDGSIVWLNASSSLRYPTAFAKEGRTVELDGEAYFEVRLLLDRDQHKIPFTVAVPGPHGNEIQFDVKGTSFNLTAYKDNLFVKATLLEGGIDVKEKRESMPLHMHPGQQYTQYPSGRHSILDLADARDVLAWKNGEFQFRDASAREILQEIGRWYDTKILFRDSIPGSFTVSGSREEPAANILRHMEQTNNIHFDIDEKTNTITVSR